MVSVIRCVLIQSQRRPIIPVGSLPTRYSTILSTSLSALVLTRTKLIQWPIREFPGAQIEISSSRRGINGMRFLHHQIGDSNILMATQPSNRPQISKKMRSSRCGWEQQDCRHSVKWLDGMTIHPWRPAHTALMLMTVCSTLSFPFFYVS